jgi:DNA replication protein
MNKSHMLRWLNEGSVSIPKMLFHYYKQVGITEGECMLLLQVYTFAESGNFFPTPEELSERMTYSSEDCMEMLRSLMQKGVLTIDEHQDIEKGYYSETYSLLSLWEKLLVVSEPKQEKKGSLSEPNLYTIFETEFGRPLSPVECETLAMWMDQDEHPALLIQAALKEGVLSGKMNFRYIDRILFEWKKNGIQTVEQAREYGEKFRKYQSRTKSNTETEPKKKVTYPFYNWLEQS